MKHRVRSTLSVLSLTTGLVVSLLIIVFVRDEFSFDTYHQHAGRIYRLANNWKGGDNVTPWARTATPMAPAIVREFPEVIEAVRVRKNPRTDLIVNNEIKFYEKGLFFADSNVFNVFSWKLKIGNPNTALVNKGSVVITEQIAEKYFGNEDPLGRILTYDNQYDLQITGILEPVPANSHFRFDMLADFQTAREVLGEKRTNNWFWFDIHTYLLLAPGTNSENLEGKLPDVIMQNIPQQYAEMFGLFLQPITEIHLTSHLKDEWEKNSNIEYSYILLTVAFFIMMMACINFINQATAGFSSRFVEIGIRKVFGAHRKQLITQYLIEAMITTMIAFVLSLSLVLILLPAFNDLTGKQIEVLRIHNVELLVYYSLFAVLVGLLAGSYPAVVLSRLQPIMAIQGAMRAGKSSKHFRNLLVTLQVTISLLLIISTVIVSGQLKYFHTTNFGFERDQIVIIPIKDRSRNEGHQTLINQLIESPSIENASFTSSIPGSNNAMSFYYRPLASDKDAQRISTFLVDNQFMKVFGLDPFEDVDMSIEQKEDTISYIIVNQSFVDFFDLEDPVGKLIQSGVTHKIIGVVRDFNVKSLHHSLEPALLSYGPQWFRFVTVKVRGSQLREGLVHMERTWTSFYSGYPFDYSFLDDRIEIQYESERKLASIFRIFSVITILIAGLGLVSLASAMVNKRTREIGIRKVLGGTVGQILIMFSKDFLLLIAIAMVIAVPVANYLMNKWLSSFAYRIDITLMYFVFPVLAILVVILLTVGTQVLRAALTNPVESLRYE